MALDRLPSTRLRARDLRDEALLGLVTKPARSALTTLGTVLGVGTFVAILGLTATATSQIGSQFNVLKATEVTVDDARSGDASTQQAAFPTNAEVRVGALNGVVASGVSWSVRSAGSSSANPSGLNPVDAPVIAATPGLFTAANVHVQLGRTFDDFHNSTQQRVAVLGSAIASQLGIRDLSANPAVFIGGLPFTVIGVIDNSVRRPDLVLAVVVPANTASTLWGPPDPGGDDSMLIVTRLGAAPQVATEAALALRPDLPNALSAVPPPDPHSLRDKVNTDLATLFLALSGICLVIGTIGIANTTLVSVMERVPEIGLRRALGARGRHIWSQFLAESAILGGVGGLIGTSVGVVTVVLVAVFKQWTPVIAPNTVLLAPLIGLGAGVLAGLYPSLRAAQIQPVEALRR